MLKKDASYYDQHSFSSTDPEPGQLAIGTEAWISELDNLEPYMKMLSEREQRWVIEHTTHDQAPHMIAAKYNVSVERWRKGNIAVK